MNHRRFTLCIKQPYCENDQLIHRDQHLIPSIILLLIGLHRESSPRCKFSRKILFTEISDNLL